MAPKTPRTPQTPSKFGTKVEWKSCASCASTFVLRDSLRHEAVCSVIASQDFTDADVNHGFVFNKRLCGVIEDKACKECLQHVHMLQKSHVALVSPSAMQLCGIVIGSHIEVETFDSKSSTFVAWPCCHIPPSSIFIDPESILFVYMYKFHEKGSNFISSSKGDINGPAKESLCLYTK